MNAGHLDKLRMTKLKKLVAIFQDVETALNLLQPFRYQEWPVSNFS